MDNMDKYAQVLKATGNVSKLNKLTHSLLETDVRRPEVAPLPYAHMLAAIIPCAVSCVLLTSVEYRIRK